LHNSNFNSQGHIPNLTSSDFSWGCGADIPNHKNDPKKKMIKFGDEDGKDLRETETVCFV